MVIFYFINEHLISIDGIIFNYSIDLLSKIKNYNEIFVVNYPGSYTGIRKSIAITLAMNTIFPNIKTYSINLLSDFGIIFNNKIFFKEKHVIHFYDKEEQKMQLFSTSHLEILIQNSKILGNIQNIENKFIDFSLENIYKNIHLISKKILIQEYFDKFTSN